MIDPVSTIIGFSQFTLFNFFFYYLIFLVRNAKKTLNSLNREKPPTIVKTASIVESTLFSWKILKVVNLIFY